MSIARLEGLGIPAKFRILNNTVRVKEIPDLPDSGRYGDYDSDRLEIRLFTHGLTDDRIVHTFYHELAHVLLEFTGQEELNRDEAYVDFLGGLLAQFHSSRTFF